MLRVFKKMYYDLINLLITIIQLARRTADHCTWTIGSAEVARAERGEDKEKRRRKRAGAVEREMAGGGEEEEPVVSIYRFGYDNGCHSY